MRKLADSLLLACLNLGVIALAHLCGLVQIGNSKLGFTFIYVLALASPVLLLATVVYLPRDLMRRASRIQALIGLLLSIAAIKFVILLRPP